MLIQTLASALLSSASFLGATTLPVTEDASVILSSYGIGNAADSNFGFESEIAVGQYHLVSEGLVKFDLSSLTAPYRKFELVISTPRVVGSIPASFGLAEVDTAWDEGEVTWNTKPAVIQDLGTFEIESLTKITKIDVTDVVLASRSQNGQIAFQISAVGSSNLFLGSREAELEIPSVYLRIQP